MIDTSTPEIQAQIPLLRTETEIKARSLPEGARPIHEWAEEGCTDPNFLEVCEYLLSRGSHLAGATTYYWTPNAQEHHFNRRLIIPYYHYGKIVGWTGRVTHSSLPSKYWNVIPEGLLYNTAALHDPKRSIAIIVEGVLDAVAIDCVGTNGNNLSQYQIDTIRDSGKRIIVLPDRDTAGKSLIDIAMKYDWEVSFPRITGRSGLQRGWWDHSTTHGFIKDAAEAVNKYCVLYTVRSIIESSVKGNIRIGQIRKLSSLFT